MKVSLQLCSYLVASLFVFSCSADEPSDGGTGDRLIEQKLAQLKNADDFGAKPAHDDLIKLAGAFRTSVDTLVELVTKEHLLAAQSQWKQLAKAVKKSELYNIGGVKDSYFHYQLHRWPINADLLEDSLSGISKIDETYISQLGSQILGLGSVEYLLFQKGTDELMRLFYQDPRRLLYLREATQHLKNTIENLSSEWYAYSPTFRKATESRISGGQNQMINSLLSFVEQTERLRLGKPIGENSAQISDVLKLEAPYSDYSLELIKSGFEEWKYCFYGDFPNSQNNFGFDDYLVNLGARELLDRITGAVEDCDAELANIHSLNNVLLGEPSQVAKLQESFKMLAVLIKADMASTIGATITVNDSDGD